MTQWTAFVGLTGVVCALLLLLSHATKTALTEPAVSERETGTETDSDSDSDSDFDSTSSSRSRSRPNPRRNANSAPASDADGREHEYKHETDSAVAKPETGVDRRTEPNSGLERGDGVSIEGEDEFEPRSDFDGAGRNGENRSRSRAGAGERRPAIESMSTGALLANVAFSQGLFAAILMAAALYTEIPADALGIAFTRGYLVTGVVLGTGIGVVLYVANELGAVAVTRAGIDHSEELREVLAPDSLRGWLILLVAVLPIIAVFEEFLFRAALIGVVSAGFGVSPWALAAVSSVAFALGHGMQGTAGIVVTGALGFVLAAVFIWTGSFLVVVVAHYLVNAFEFVVHEGLGLEWTEGASKTTER